MGAGRLGLADGPADSDIAAAVDVAEVAVETAGAGVVGIEGIADYVGFGVVDAAARSLAGLEGLAGDCFAAVVGAGRAVVVAHLLLRQRWR